MEYKAVFLCGDPDYYLRFGFRPTSGFGITHKSVPEPFIMGRELIHTALRDVTGVVKVE